MKAWLRSSIEKLYFSSAIVLIIFSIIANMIAVASATEPAPGHAVLLDVSSVTSEVCVVTVHRSQMRDKTPVARCATPEELKAMVK